MNQSNPTNPSTPPSQSQRNRPKRKTISPYTEPPESNKKPNMNVTPSEPLRENTSESLTEPTNQVLETSTSMEFNFSTESLAIRDNVLKTVLNMFQSLEAKLNSVVTSQQELRTEFHNTITVKEEKDRLIKRIAKVESENKCLTDRIIALEDKLLEYNVILKGVHETAWETEDLLRDKIYDILSETVLGTTYDMRLGVAKTMVIRSSKRLGRYSPMRSRPISIEFLHKHDANYILQNKKHLPQGIYADKEYCRDTEEQRKQLRPYLLATRRLPQYYKKCRLEGATLVLKGTSYDINTLHKLPKELNNFNISSRSNNNVLGFFGKLNPLSNFFPCAFTHQGKNFHSSEQYIQYMKAEYCGDESTASFLLSTENALQCKDLARNITNFNKDSWNDNAKEMCESGISAKFEQNPELAEVLTSTNHKTLVKCCSDRVWGNGVPLFDDNCLKPEFWSGQGILGEILEEVRSKLQESILNPTCDPPMESDTSEHPNPIRDNPSDETSLAAKEPRQFETSTAQLDLASASVTPDPSVS